MKWLQKLFNFLRKDNKIKRLDAGTQNENTSYYDNQTKLAFINSLKIEKNVFENASVQTHICLGDGLGIKTKISY